MAAITNDWLDAINGEFKKDYYRDLYLFIKKEYSTQVVYPVAEDIFNAFHLTPLSNYWTRPLSQCKSGTWSLLFGKA